MHLVSHSQFSSAAPIDTIKENCTFSCSYPPILNVSRLQCFVVCVKVGLLTSLSSNSCHRPKKRCIIDSIAGTYRAIVKRNIIINSYSRNCNFRTHSGKSRTNNMEIESKSNRLLKNHWRADARKGIGLQIRRLEIMFLDSALSIVSVQCCFHIQMTSEFEKIQNSKMCLRYMYRASFQFHA